MDKNEVLSLWRKLCGKLGLAILSALAPILLGVFSNKIFGCEFEDMAKGFIVKILGDDTYVAELTAEPNRRCRVGDLVTVNGVYGVVFQTKPQVKVVSVEEISAAWGQGVYSGSEDSECGKANMAAIQSMPNWQRNYPVFKWCADLGEGWYLPSLNELKVIYEHKEKIDKRLQKNNYKTLGSESPYSYLWSSSEANAYDANSIIFSNGTTYTDGKTESNAARAIFALGGVVTDSDEKSSALTAAVCNIGDVVTIAGVQGVVFQTSPQVKVVSVVTIESVWSKNSATIGATNWDDGKANMEKVQHLANWQSDYPAFSWCAELGEGWYLPAINELDAIYSQKEEIDKSLKANGSDKLDAKDRCLWSSTECYSSHAYDINLSYGFYSNYNKNNQNAVRAVYSF